MKPIDFVNFVESKTKAELHSFFHNEKRKSETTNSFLNLINEELNGNNNTSNILLDKNLLFLDSGWSIKINNVEFHLFEIEKYLTTLKQLRCINPKDNLPVVLWDVSNRLLQNLLFHTYTVIILLTPFEKLDVIRKEQKEYSRKSQLRWSKEINNAEFNMNAIFGNNISTSGFYELKNKGQVYFKPKLIVKSYKKPTYKIIT